MFTSEPIVVRPAAPTLEEGSLFAGYLDRAAEGFFRLMLGPRYRETLAEAYTHPGHDLSFERITCAERGGRVVGMASAYSSEEHRRSTDRPLVEAAGYPRLRAALVGTLFARILRFLDHLDDGDSYLQAVAVDRACRGRGVGSILIESVEQRAREVGSARLCLDVSGGNGDARRLYERLGMTVVGELQGLPLVPRSRILRMAKRL